MSLRKCLICGNTFVPITYRHKFCCRKCFIIYYRKQAKIEDFPYYICQNCGKKTKLKFNPKTDIKKWENYKCPACKFNKRKELEKEIKKIEEDEKIKKKIYS